MMTEAIPRPADPLTTVFFGTGDIARPAFAALLARPDIKVLGLVTQPDKPVGRHQVLSAPAIKSDALAAGVPVWQPLKSRELVPMLGGLGADVFLVMAYGQILPQDLLALPKRVCWNLHASLLPRHRGASPIQAAILAGDPASGVTVMHVARALDAGDIVLAESIVLEDDETGGRLHDRLAALAPIAMNRALDALVANTATRTPQDVTQATVLGKLDRADGNLDWAQPAAMLARRIRAFDPWPGTFTRDPHGRILKIYPPVAAEPHAPPRALPGTVVAADTAGLLIACGDGAIRVTSVQPEGKRRMTAADFLRGHPLVPGAVRFGDGE